VFGMALLRSTASAMRAPVRRARALAGMLVGHRLNVETMAYRRVKGG
jgi:hypothetical protein